MARADAHCAAIHIQHWPRGAEPPSSVPRNLASYYNIAEHYRFALTRVFDVLKFDQAVLLEDDMELAPDFFSYFAALVPVLQLRVVVAHSIATDWTLRCAQGRSDTSLRQVRPALLGSVLRF